jgi:ubiquitin C-terminal hydrolase
MECQTKTKALIKLKLKKLPIYLMIHLKRFVEVKNKYIKNKKYVEYPLIIDMNEFSNKPWKNLGKY